MWFALEGVLAGWLVLGVPLVGRRRYRALRAAVAADSDARVGFYRRSAGRQWLLAAVAVALVVAGGRPLASIGLVARLQPGAAAVPLAALLAAAVLVTVIVALRRAAASREPWGARTASSVVGLLPATRRERRWFAGVAVTAGVTEELLYRGFLAGWLLDEVPGLPAFAALALSAVAFALGHAYQGLPGMVGTGLAGLGFATVYAAAGTVLVAMAAHAALDLRVLAARPETTQDARRAGRHAADHPAHGS
jgi:membrane protease YdiL (CAAX protease family)